MPELTADLVERLRQILAERPETESELRSLLERAHRLEHALADDVEASEARLGELSDDPACSVTEAASLLRRVEALRPALFELRGQLGALERRSRRLRTEWLLHQTGSAPGDAARAQPGTSTNAIDGAALGRPRPS